MKPYPCGVDLFIVFQQLLYPVFPKLADAKLFIQIPDLFNVGVFDGGKQQDVRFLSSCTLRRKPDPFPDLCRIPVKIFHRHGQSRILPSNK